MFDIDLDLVDLFIGFLSALKLATSAKKRGRVIRTLLEIQSALIDAHRLQQNLL